MLSVKEFGGQNKMFNNLTFYTDGGCSGNPGPGGFGNAFAGKYESVFCINVGTIEQRLEAVENAVRTVYASTMDRSALEYRRQT